MTSAAVRGAAAAGTRASSMGLTSVAVLGRPARILTGRLVERSGDGAASCWLRRSWPALVMVPLRPYRGTDRAPGPA